MRVRVTVTAAERSRGVAWVTPEKSTRVKGTKGKGTVEARAAQQQYLMVCLSSSYTLMSTASLRVRAHALHSTSISCLGFCTFCPVQGKSSKDASRHTRFKRAIEGSEE